MFLTPALEPGPKPSSPPPRRGGPGQPTEFFEIETVTMTVAPPSAPTWWAQQTEPIMPSTTNPASNMPWGPAPNGPNGPDGQGSDGSNEGWNGSDGANEGSDSNDGSASSNGGSDGSNGSSGGWNGWQPSDPSTTTSNGPSWPTTTVESSSTTKPVWTTQSATTTPVWSTQSATTTQPWYPDPSGDDDWSVYQREVPAFEFDADDEMVG